MTAPTTNAKRFQKNERTRLRTCPPSVVSITTTSFFSFAPEVSEGRIFMFQLGRALTQMAASLLLLNRPQPPFGKGGRGGIFMVRGCHPRHDHYLLNKGEQGTNPHSPIAGYPLTLWAWPPQGSRRSFPCSRGRRQDEAGWSRSLCSGDPGVLRP
jgi:hypothetical protein